MKNKLVNYAFVILIVATVFLGGYIAYKTLYTYEVVVKLVLAGWLLLLVYKEFFGSDNNSQNFSKITLVFPRDLKLIPYTLIMSIVLGWAFKQFADALFFVIYRLFD